VYGYLGACARARAVQLLMLIHSNAALRLLRLYLCAVHLPGACARTVQCSRGAATQQYSTRTARLPQQNSVQYTRQWRLLLLRRKFNVQPHGNEVPWEGAGMPNKAAGFGQRPQLLRVT
jgi:hypothetical protein